MSPLKDFWNSQELNKPLYEDMLWSKPENKNYAGKILIIGGHANSFSIPAESYSFVNNASAGVIKICLPDRLRKIVGNLITDVAYLPSNPSGSFAKEALGELIAFAQWSDVVLLSGDFGRNSETSIMLERFISEYKGKLVLVNDSLDYFVDNPNLFINRPNTLIVATIAELQKISLKVNPEKLIKFSMDLINLVDAVHELNTKFNINIITKHQGNIITTSESKLSTTKLIDDPLEWRTGTASYASVWWAQNNSNVIKALTCSNYEWLVR